MLFLLFDSCHGQPALRRWPNEGIRTTENCAADVLTTGEMSGYSKGSIIVMLTDSVF